MKAGVMADSERDAGFSSGADEDDMSGLHSPSASEDSLEVQVTPISLRNKRKLAEPRKIQEPSTAPLKKRRFERVEVTPMVPDDEESRTTSSPSPFRPWSSSSKTVDAEKVLPPPVAFKPLTGTSTNDRQVEQKAFQARRESQRTEDPPTRLRHSTQSRLTRIERRDHPIGQKSESAASSGHVATNDASANPTATSNGCVAANTHPRLQEEPLSLVLRGEVEGRVPSHPAVNGTYERTYPVDRVNVSSASSSSCSSSSSSSSSSSASTSASSSSCLLLNRQENHPVVNDNDPSPMVPTNAQTSHTRQHSSVGQQRNYKNMTRERRIEANARERTRVHTISAAFDTLRRAIPAYSHNQKLSKLSVLRIACSYIMTLGKIVGTPEGESTNTASLGACVDLVSRTIQTEGKLRKRKED